MVAILNLGFCKTLARPAWPYPLRLPGFQTSILLHVQTSILPNFYTSRRIDVCASTRLDVYMSKLLYFQAYRRLCIYSSGRLNFYTSRRIDVQASRLPGFYTSTRLYFCTSVTLRYKINIYKLTNLVYSRTCIYKRRPLQSVTFRYIPLLYFITSMAIIKIYKQQPPGDENGTN